jgi:hypothetical protein
MARENSIKQIAEFAAVHNKISRTGSQTSLSGSFNSNAEYSQSLNRSKRSDDAPTPVPKDSKTRLHTPLKERPSIPTTVGLSSQFSSSDNLFLTENTRPTTLSKDIDIDSKTKPIITQDTQTPSSQPCSKQIATGTKFSPEKISSFKYEQSESDFDVDSMSELFPCP